MPQLSAKYRFHLSRHAKQSLLLALFLVFIQAGLPLLTAPTQKTDSNGQIIWVCTLQGLQQILSDPAGQGENNPEQSSFQCPTCSLGQLFASAIPPYADIAVQERTKRASFPPNQRSAQPYHLISAVQVRAPPIS